MNNQLDQLQSAIDSLIHKYQTASKEQERLNREIAVLKADHIQSQQKHQAAIDELNAMYTNRLKKLESNSQENLQKLRAENASYRKLLEQSASEIRKLLERLPQLPPQKEDAA